MQGSSAQLNCFRCSNPLDFKPLDKISARESCNKCSVSLRCCQMCHFFNNAHYNQCAEPNAERVVDKDRLNYCDYFMLSGERKSSSYDKDNLFELAQSLFKE